MKSNVVAIVALLSSLMLMIFFQQQSERLRKEDRAKDVGVSYLKREKMPTAGFDAVAADLIWMRTNLRRQPKLRQDISREEKKEFLLREAKRDFVGYNKVVLLDPTFKRAYNFAILRLMSELPDQAINLADMAMVYLKNDTKEFSELAGHIASTVKKDYKAALDYYEKCVSGGPSKDYLGRRYLRTLLRIEGINPYEKTLENQAKQIVAYYEANKNMMSSLEGMGEFGDMGMEGMEGIEGAEGMEAMDFGDVQSESWIQPILLDEIRKFLGRTSLEKHSLSNKKIEEVKTIYKSFAPKGHACQKCYAEYDAGDMFCYQCGLDLKPYGVCAKKDCGTILKGHFCHTCGEKAPKGFVPPPRAKPSTDVAEPEAQPL